MRKTSAEYSATWRAKHPNGNKEALARFRAEHPERVQQHKRTYYQRHKEEVIAANRGWRNANRERFNATERIAAKKPERQMVKRLWKWRRRYGLTADAATALMAAQQHACAICATPFAEIKLLHVDHCHTSNTVRGFLCHLCNVGLGSFRDNPDYLSSAVEYLRRSSHVVPS